MSNTVYYHHPDDNQYSLAYVTEDRDSIHSSDSDAKIERFDFGTPFYVLYTNNGASGTVDDIDDKFDQALDSFDSDDRIITLRYLQIFEGVIEEKELEEGEKLGIYKNIEVENIPDALSQIDWTGAAVDVAGQLMSTLILKHALPNANHRTSISLAEWYLESAQSGFSLPKLATQDYDWQRWVDDYIAESKRILTVRRNTTAFSFLQDWGCEVVERKGDISIKLADYDLTLPRSKALTQYAQKHADLCTEFMIDSVERGGHTELIRISGPTKSDFATYLSESA
ncbi:hypothetical protein GJR96_09235 [Haloferax sp. MBLA0076]|uniref:Uncharacterized protein n=1 Tax=Haloferax litoreum TaxID=2666140 RepID=A0A6A8GGW7_9EURY|nr:MULTISPECIES: hypothetical protein [Haloferax]KAB1193617.1 hypothetical protein Hfx1148_09220 [Haloferax sp. CBA1148]MRX22136.1 hypothetical protein [Haloferax litoreum]